VARAAIARIVADTEQAFDAARYWPWHPMDFDGDPGMPVSCLYYGQNRRSGQQRRSISAPNPPGLMPVSQPGDITVRFP
jgi:hypothetical protein